jgi:hypothetical protein
MILKPLAAGDSSDIISSALIAVAFEIAPSSEHLPSRKSTARLIS